MNHSGKSSVSGVALLVMGLFATPAAGCPFCETAQAREVRGAIFGVDFWPTLGALAAPFLVLGAGVVWYYRAGRGHK